jgi:hypothetical protein
MAMNSQWNIAPFNQQVKLASNWVFGWTSKQASNNPDTRRRPDGSERPHQAGMYGSLVRNL